LRLIENPDTLREQVKHQVRAERESKPWLRDAREAASARERLAKLETVEDNYRDQQAEGLITMAKLREKLDGVSEEREGLEARLALLADRESRLRELEELPALVDEYLEDLPYLVDLMPVIREYELARSTPQRTCSGSARSPPENPVLVQGRDRREKAGRRGRKGREVAGALCYARPSDGSPR
jgi:hypothetical protein